MPPRVGIVLGSTSDEEKAKTAAVMLEKFGVEYEMEVLSAHRDPRRVAEYGASAADRGLQVLIAAAGKAAALPGVLAAHANAGILAGQILAVGDARLRLQLQEFKDQLAEGLRL